MQPRMPFDDLAWEKSEDISDAWVDQLFANENTLWEIGHFIVQHRKGVPLELCDPKAGYFNIMFRMKFQDGGSAVIRFPKPGATMFPEEKVRNEVAAIRYIHEHTSIPVPFILHWGTKEESPLGLGPFIIMEYIEHEMNMTRALNTAGFRIEDRPRLDPNIDIGRLEMLYGQFAEILLQLNRICLPKIGALEQVDDIDYEIKHRPLSIHMNELVRLGTLPRSNLPKRVFQSSSSYFASLAELHIEHLKHQRNDAIDSDKDFRRKYVARQLFHKLVTERRLASSKPEQDRGPFSIWCDDLRPSNVLLNADMQVVGVIDWEFTYAAPTEFPSAPPWWLLLEQPEYWREGIEDWSRVYEQRLSTFLKVMAQREDALIASGRLTENQRLSDSMRESWDCGDFWVCYAARKSFAFDSVYWHKIDQRFFGTVEKVENAWTERLHLLDGEKRREMEALLKQKTEDMKERVLQWDPNE